MIVFTQGVAPSQSISPRKSTRYKFGRIPLSQSRGLLISTYCYPDNRRVSRWLAV